MRQLRRALAAALLTIAAAVGSADAQSAQVPKLKELTLDELGSLEVTSVSRHAERLADAPAALFVITADDIRRTGATSLAEALRLAPNLQVARLDASQYAISARGFNNAISNKLLVLVDGRTIYTPLFSGVFWDQQDVLLEDVERIEIISGPGATLWGANAVNGVINVITRPASETQGVLVSVGGGNREQVGAVRVGGGFSERGHVRAYAKTTHLENTTNADGVATADSRKWFQAGFRADIGDDGNGWTLQGDAYHGQSEDRGSVLGFVLGRVELSGMNALARYTRQVSNRSNVRVQAYFDHYSRDERVLFQPEANLFDVEAQHAISMNRHRLLYGAGYRYGSDRVEDGILILFRPTAKSLNWGNVFVQDEFKLSDQIEVSGGFKLERNDYTGWEYLPSARVAWKSPKEQLVWAAASRAVRAPARLDREIGNQFGTVVGGPNFQSEVANVFELGYRGRPLNSVTTSVTGFLHQWDRVRSGTAPPVLIENRIEGPVYGVEVWATWQPVRIWSVHGGVTAFEKDLRLEPGSADPVGAANPNLANDPGHQWLLRSSFTLWSAHELDIVARHVAALPTPVVPAYTTGDIRYAWHLRSDLELALKAQDLLGRAHSEFGAAATRSEFERSVFLQVRWSR